MMTDIYNQESIEKMEDDDSLDAWEEGFMQGYLRSGYDAD